MYTAVLVLLGQQSRLTFTSQLARRRQQHPSCLGDRGLRLVRPVIPPLSSTQRRQIFVFHLVLHCRVFADLDLGETSLYIVATHYAGGVIVRATPPRTSALRTVSSFFATHTRAPPFASLLATISLSGSFGLVADPRGVGYLVVQLLVSNATTGHGLRIARFLLHSRAVESELWWAAYCLIAFNVFEDQSRPLFVPIPAV